MADELSLKAVRQFMLRVDGSARNKDIVRHFKDFINDPQTKAQTREEFKEFVNLLSNIKTIDGERLLVLKSTFQVSDDLPADATSDEIRAHSLGEKPKQHGQDACAQAIASARAIRDLYNPIPPPRRRKDSKGANRQPPRLLMGENSQALDPVSPPPTDDETKVPAIVMSPVTSPIELDFDASSSEAGTPVDVIMKSIAVPRGPSQSIRRKAEALEKVDECETASSYRRDVDVENVGVVMESVAAKAAALGEKLGGDDDDDDDDVDGERALPSRSRVAAAILDIDRSAGDKLETALVRPSTQHRPAASRSERTRALKETFVGKMPSPVLGSGSRLRSYSAVAPSQRSPMASRRAGMDHVAGAGVNHGDRSPTVKAAGFSPVLSRASGAVHLTRRHGPLKKKDSKGSMKVVAEKDGGGSDGEDSDESSQDFSHVALDSMERQWLVVASEANFSHVNQMLLRNSSLVNKKDFINTALHWAIKLDKLDTVRLLLESNADPNLKTGQTALHLAAKFGRSNVISLLVDNHGVDVYARDHAGKQPRDIASAKVKEECKVMLDWKDVDSSPPEIEVPLKTSGSFTSDVQDGSWKPSRSRNFFSPGILKRSFRRLRGKTPKEKPVITHVYPQPSGWTDEPERGNGEYKLSTSEGDLTAID